MLGQIPIPGILKAKILTAEKLCDEYSEMQAHFCFHPQYDLYQSENNALWITGSFTDYLLIYGPHLL